MIDLQWGDKIALVNRSNGLPDVVGWVSRIEPTESGGLEVTLSETPPCP